MGSVSRLTEGSNLVIRYGSHKKVEIFELCEVKTVSKWWGSENWDILSDE